MSIQIAEANHGKARVRLVKVKRVNDVHSVKQLTVMVLLDAPAAQADIAFRTGDNSPIVPTDTVKNTVLTLSKKNSFDSIEEFGQIVAKHFLVRHPDVVERVRVTIHEEQWVPFEVRNSRGVVQAHKHAFYSPNTKTRFTKVDGRSSRGGPLQIRVTSGVEGFKILKTTRTAFVGFKKDEYTTLPEATDRLLGTVLFAEWEYDSSHPIASYEGMAAEIERIMIQAFTGPADTGVHSPSVQKTMYDMASEVLSRVPAVLDMHMSMPNVHNLPLDLSRYGVPVNTDVLVPTDEPHGMIEARLTRPGASRL